LCKVSGADAVSQIATKIAKTVTRTKLLDPMSGFFMMTRDAFESVLLRPSGQGFKILLDIVASSERPLRVVEKACCNGAKLIHR
jgi:dolichol-phosphate mannosyltransferase